MRGHLADDEPVVLDFTEHPVTLVNFWAIWCEPCKREMPRLEQLHRERARDGLEIVGVLRNGDSDGETLRAYLEETGITYRVVRPRQRYLSQWAGTSVLPTSFLIDRDGTIRRRYVGATAEQTDALIYDLEAALDGRPLGPIVVPEIPDAASEANRPKIPDRVVD
jgi:thiol-disulfide isomerase/thioredoxin